MATAKPERARRIRGTRTLTNLEQAVRFESLLGKSRMSSSATLIARLTIRRGYAGRARRPKIQIGYAEPEVGD